MILYEQRASTILYNFLISTAETKPFLIPANICPIVPLIFLKAKKTFEFIDISPTTLCIDENSVIERISKQPSNFAGIIFVRTYGAIFSEELFFRQLKNINSELLIIDDRCLSLPDFTRPSETCCDLVLYSTGYAKVVDLDWGGFGFLRKGLSYHREITPFSPQTLQTIETDYKAHLANRSPFTYRDSGWLDTTLPELAYPDYKNLVETRLAAALEHKAQINEIYATGLPPEIQLAATYQQWRFNVVVPRKTDLLDKIFEQGLFASTHYAALDGIFGGERMPVAEKLHGRVVNLFNDFHVDSQKARMLVRIINDHLFS